VFGLAVALVADSLPEGIRPKALGLLQSLSAVGNITAGLCAMALSHVDPAQSWKYLFWIGSAPAFLCIFIMVRLKEPQKWLDARATSQSDNTKKMGSYGSLLGDPKWSKSAWLGMLLCICGVVGLWGVGFFSNQLVAPAIAASLKDQGLSPQELQQSKQWWSAANLIVQNIGAFFGIKAWGKTPRGRYTMDFFKLKIPVVGELSLKMSVARFSRTFGTLINSGVPMMRSLEIVGETLGNVVLTRAIDDTRASIREGNKLSMPLAQSGLFPAMVTTMIDIGEESGRLSEMLVKVGDFYDQEVESTVKGLTSMIEPLLIMFLGCVVGFIAISIMTPIFKLVNSVK
jgi:hypothetical protein